MRHLLIATLVLGTGVLAASCTTNPPPPSSAPAPAAPAPAAPAPPPAPAAPAPSAPAPSAAGANILQQACAGCHGLETVTFERHTRDDWQSIIIDMMGKGASLSDAEAGQLATYLAANYGPQTPP